MLSAGDIAAAKAHAERWERSAKALLASKCGPVHSALLSSGYIRFRLDSQQVNTRRTGTAIFVGNISNATPASSVPKWIVHSTCATVHWRTELSRQLLRPHAGTSSCAAREGAAAPPRRTRISSSLRTRH